MFVRRTRGAILFFSSSGNTPQLHLFRFFSLDAIRCEDMPTTWREIEFQESPSSIDSANFFMHIFGLGLVWLLSLLRAQIIWWSKAPTYYLVLLHTCSKIHLIPLLSSVHSFSSLSFKLLWWGWFHIRGILRSFKRLNFWCTERPSLYESQPLELPHLYSTSKQRKHKIGLRDKNQTEDLLPNTMWTWNFMYRYQGLHK